MTYENFTAKIWSKPNCPYCTQAKFLLKKHNIPYTEYYMTDGPLLEGQIRTTREEVLKKTPTAKTFPQIYLYNDEQEIYIGGCSDFEIYLTSK